ncbi:MAG: lasso RiPP family leader peptide-containing protein [bacterium]
MNQHNEFDELEVYEKPRLIELGELRELVRGTGSNQFDSLGDSPACTSANGVQSAPDDNC